MEGYTLATATPCIHISLRMGMEPKKTGRRGRERRERQGGRVWRKRGEAGRGGGWREKGKWTRKGRNSRRGRNGKREGITLITCTPSPLTLFTPHPLTPSLPTTLTPFIMRNSTTLLWPRERQGGERFCVGDHEHWD